MCMFWHTSRSWPKGKINEGESPFDCGLRETLEETGYNAASLCFEEHFLVVHEDSKLTKLFVAVGNAITFRLNLLLQLPFFYFLMLWTHLTYVHVVYTHFMCTATSRRSQWHCFWNSNTKRNIQGDVSSVAAASQENLGRWVNSKCPDVMPTYLLNNVPFFNHIVPTEFRSINCFVLNNTQFKHLFRSFRDFYADISHRRRSTKAAPVACLLQTPTPARKRKVVSQSQPWQFLTIEILTLSVLKVSASSVGRMVTNYVSGFCFVLVICFGVVFYKLCLCMWCLVCFSDLRFRFGRRRTWLVRRRYVLDVKILLWLTYPPLQTVNVAFFTWICSRYVQYQCQVDR